MTRKEAESRIMDLLVQINAIVKEYYPADDYLTLTCSNDCLRFNNEYWEHPTEGVLRRTRFLDQEGGEFDL